MKPAVSRLDLLSCWAASIDRGAGAKNEKGDHMRDTRRSHKLIRDGNKHQNNTEVHGGCKLERERTRARKSVKVSSDVDELS